MSTPGPGPSKSRRSWIPQRLRLRQWFWPKAAWIGFGWFGRIVDHPLSSFFAWVLALATIFLGGIALQVSPIIIFLAVIIVFMFVVARGARLKWEQDRGTVPRPEHPATPPVTYMGGEHTHFHFGEDTDTAAALLKRISGVETDLPVPDQPPVREQEPQSNGHAGDHQGDDDDEQGDGSAGHS